MIANAIRQTTTTTGTGNLTLSSVTDFVTFNAAFGTSQRFRYFIIDDSSLAPIESGIGHLSASTTLVRDWVLYTYSAGTPTRVDAASGHVNLASGTKRVICSLDESAPMTNPLNPPVRNNTTANNRLLLPANYLSTSASGLSLTINRLYAWPVFIQHRGPFDAFGFRFSTTGANVDMGLYRMDETGLPGAQVAGTTGVASATGMIFGTVTAFSVIPGWHIATLNTSNATPTVYFGSINEGYGRSDTATQLPLAYVAQTQGTLPDPYGTPTVIGNLANVPIIVLRLQ